MDIRNKVLKRQNTQISKKFQRAHVSILGTGGLGSNVAMMLARAGVGNLYLFDYDKVEYSNLNRQNFFLRDIGEEKVNATKKRILSAIPYVNVKTFQLKLTENNLPNYLDTSDIFVEAFDDPKAKAMTFNLFSSLSHKYLISVSGIGGMEDYENIKVKHMNNVCIYGDFKTDQSEGLYSPNVTLYAALQSGEVLRIIRDHF